MLIILFFGLSHIAHGQIDCGTPWPEENLRPDTVSTFLFTNKSLSATLFQNAKPTSNFGLKTKFLDLTWMPINTSDIIKFIDMSLKNIDKNQIIDTLDIKIFGQDHKTIVIKSKKKILLIAFLNQPRQQDIFISTIHNKNKIKQTIEFLENNLL